MLAESPTARPAQAHVHVGRPKGDLLAPACLTVLMAFSFMGALYWVSHRFFWGDEFLELLTDQQSSAKAILNTQLTAPWAFEPPGWHILQHWMLMLVPARPEISSRLLSVIGLPISEWCIYRVTKRLTQSSAAALIAASMILILACSSYAGENRGYMVIFTLFTVALMSYQGRLYEPSERTSYTVMLGASLSAATLIHYFGIFMLAPFIGAEAYRVGTRRRFDVALLLALAAPVLCFGLDAPFFKALHVIQQHYYHSTAENGLNAYMWLWLGKDFYLMYPGKKELIEYATTVLGLLGIAWFGLIRPWRRWNRDTQEPVMVAVAIATVFPILVWGLSQITHAFTFRYTLPAAAGLAVLTAVAVQANTKREGIQITLCGVALLLGAYQLRSHWQDAKDEAEQLTKAYNAPAMKALIESEPDHHIYTQASAHFFIANRYGPPYLKAALVNLRDTSKELYWRDRWPSSIIDQNIAAKTDLPMITYQEFRSRPGKHVLLVFHDATEEWIDKEVDSGTLPTTYLGRGLRGRLYETYPF